ncbi:hypothetical protein [Thermoanaerobacterium sp. DL9XJH110]|uniref:hypothetical protein n=1 Tax=Thermoanaerobacterium sp. DL9XJH110 TaxID=3386643 RepID=UPI003BB5D94F
MQDKLKILIAASQDVPAVRGPFQIKFGGEFAARKFIPHITDGKGRQSAAKEAANNAVEG